MALITVLWTLALLALVAESLMSSSNLFYHLAHNTVTRVRAEALAEAGVNRAILGLLDRRAEKRWPIGGASHEFGFERARIRVSLYDESGKVDLNGADSATLHSLLYSAGIDSQTADVLTDRILDWRDPSDLHRLNGAKDPDYRAAGYSYGPRNAPFQSVDELKLVMGMTPTIFERLKPSITIYSGRQVADPHFAPSQPVKNPAGPLTGSEAQSPAVNNSTGAVAATAADVAGRAYAIRVEVDGADGLLSREAVVRFTDNTERLFWVLSWRDGN